MNKNALSDPYVKAIRWASDRIKGEGIVAFVTNSGFVDAIAADGMRMHLHREFDEIYILDLGGNVRRNPKLSGTTHNVFGIQVGVSINFFIKRRHEDAEKRVCKIHYASVDELWKKEQKYAYLDGTIDRNAVGWAILRPDQKNNWLTNGKESEFASFLSVSDGDSSIFELHSNGLKSNRDAWAYNFDEATLGKNIRKTIAFYNEEVARWKRSGRPKDVDGFVRNADKEVAWSSDLKSHLKRGRLTDFENKKIQVAIYRPFTATNVYFDRILNERVYSIPRIFPAGKANTVIAVNMTAERPFTCLATRLIPNLVTAGGFGCATQVFPMYTYDEEGAKRSENITDSALAEFRRHYGESSISKWDIFHYTYGLLHHPEYRTRYAANLKRELPRIPMAPEFRRYAEIGAKLMKLHIDYEQQPEFPLKCTETGKLDWRVEKMALSKDKTQLKYNGFLTLSGILPDVYEYRLGNRSALEWIVDQYRVSTDKRSGIVNDPNRADDPEYIVRLIGQIVTVSLETVRLVRQLATLSIDQVSVAVLATP